MSRDEPIRIQNVATAPPISSLGRLEGKKKIVGDEESAFQP